MYQNGSRETFPVGLAFFLPSPQKKRGEIGGDSRIERCTTIVFGPSPIEVSLLQFELLPFLSLYSILVIIRDGADRCQERLCRASPKGC